MKHHQYSPIKTFVKEGGNLKIEVTKTSKKAFAASHFFFLSSTKAEHK